MKIAERGESQSISHQREIIEEFCKKKGWRVEDVYVDDGYSGTTSNRPSLQRLLSDIEEKRINVVVTKDYSRLGRDNLFIEQLREIWFPKHNCRYILYIVLKEDIRAYFEREVLPFAPDAWIDEKKSKVGYEIPFTRYFYKYEAPRPSEEIMAEIMELEKELSGSLEEVFR